MLLLPSTAHKTHVLKTKPAQFFHCAWLRRNTSSRASIIPGCLCDTSLKNLILPANLAAMRLKVIPL